MKYSQKVMDHFANPRNVGTIEEPDGVGEVGNPACGDIMTFTIKVNDGRLEDVKFQTFGCGAAIAVSSMISDMAKGKTLEEALRITNKDVAEALDGLPTNKLHCSNLGADALKAAIRDYLRQNGRPSREGTPSDADTAARKKEKISCRCPYCHIEVPSDSPICKGCGSKLASDHG
jgi:nitrogen fixation protein NifU and related proteins